jgi:hypothetical protein
MVKPLHFTVTNGQFHIDDYPDAVALKRIDTPIARQLQAVTLHQFDLTFCRDALAEIARLNRSENVTVIEGLWVAAIARYFKCFGGNKSRSQLSAKTILKDHPGAEAVFKYFQDLRDKHIIHDENPFTQAFTGVAVNGPESQYKVADIISLAFNAFTVDDAHLTQLTQLVDVTLNWVSAKRDELHNDLGRDYEQWSREKLLALPDIQYTVPGADVVGVKR